MILNKWLHTSRQDSKCCLLLLLLSPLGILQILIQKFPATLTRLYGQHTFIMALSQVSFHICPLLLPSFIYSVSCSMYLSVRKQRTALSTPAWYTVDINKYVLINTFSSQGSGMSHSGKMQHQKTIPRGLHSGLPKIYPSLQKDNK